MKPRTGHSGGAKLVMSAKPRVLIADAYREIRILESAIAAQCGCDVVVAGDASETLDHLENAAFDVLLLGSPIVMSSGAQVLNVIERELRQFAPRTIGVTTHVDDVALLRAAARARVFAVVAKPFDVAVLLTTNRVVEARHPRRDPQAFALLDAVRQNGLDADRKSVG